MKLTIAGKEKIYAEGATLLYAAETEQIENPMYATAVVNDDYLRYDDFAATVLHEGDTVEFVYFMGGGSCGVHE